MTLKVPILFVIFNREDTTKVVFEQIKQYKPTSLFIAADGPRNEAEAAVCARTREYVIKNIDWECDVQTLFREKNLGCGKAVSSAISWFFTHVEMGVILEDDCVPNKSFFQFCADMLMTHKENDNVMHVSGTWYLEPEKEDYIFSKHPFIWGWATWRRAWEKYNIELHNDNISTIEQTIFLNLKSAAQTAFWIQNFNHLLEQGFNYTWDYQWIYSIWRCNGITISPTQNLISNIGFNENATHTKEANHYLANVATKEFKNTTYFSNHKVDCELDKKIFDIYFVGKNTFKLNATKSFKEKIKQQLRKFMFKIVPELKLIPEKNMNSCSNISNQSKLHGNYKLHNSKINAYTYISQNALINNTLIGKFCSIGPNLVCGWGIHPTNAISTSPMFYSNQKQNGYSLSETTKIEETKPIIIGNDVFIGMNVTILDGVTIGDGAVIGAGAVVSKNIPAYAIAVGVPIKIIKYRFDDITIAKLKEIKWWDWQDDNLIEIEQHFFDVQKFIDKHLNN